ncbi:MAG: hypothetical protein ACRYFS_05970 [Janthinobacterium lividum]
MTLTLNPHTEARLRSFAAQHSLPPEEAVVLLLDVTDASGYYNSVEAETITAELQASVEDYAAGHWISLEDYEAEVQAERAERSIEAKSNNGR